MRTRGPIAKVLVVGSSLLITCTNSGKTDEAEVQEAISQEASQDEFEDDGAVTEEEASNVVEEKAPEPVVEEAPPPEEAPVAEEVAEVEEVVPEPEAKEELPVETGAASEEYTLSQKTEPEAVQEKQPSVEEEVELSPPSAASTAVDSVQEHSRYVVQPGDTLKEIAKKIYGTAKKWKDLQAANNIKDANKIFVGDVIEFELDSKSESFLASYHARVKSSVTVKKGDTLSKISKNVLGKSHYWRYLWRFNESKIPDPNRINVNDVLEYLPFNGEKLVH